MKVLVATASKHGSTARLGEALGSALRELGLTVDVRDAGAVRDVTPYDAVVLGSAVYVGHWLDAAKDLVARHETELRSRPVWLFSSGPLGDPPHPAGDPSDIPALSARVGARGHRTFAGRLEKDGLRVGERAVVRMVHAPYGDFRHMDDIAGWARSIAREVTGLTVR
jgi:menaquinone-dependent protoporphyrinogen oxidase